MPCCVTMYSMARRCPRISPEMTRDGRPVQLHQNFHDGFRLTVSLVTSSSACSPADELGDAECCGQIPAHAAGVASTSLQPSLFRSQRDCVAPRANLLDIRVGTAFRGFICGSRHAALEWIQTELANIQRDDATQSGDIFRAPLRFVSD